MFRVLLARYIWNILIAIDQLGNAILGGDPDETISSRATKNQHVAVWFWLVIFLETVDPGHSERTLKADEGALALRNWKADHYSRQIANGRTV